MTTPKRWQATLASALCMAAGMSAIFMGSFPVFLEPVSKDLGWDRATFPQLITIASCSGALLMPAAGRLVDRIGVRWPAACGLLLLTAGLIMLSFLKDAGLIFWAAALSIGAGSALAGPPAFIALVSSWYDRNRALALGCVLSIAPACSQAIVSPLTQRLVSDWGWRDAYRYLAIITLVAAAVAAAGFLRGRSTGSAPVMPIRPAASAGQAMRTGTFWLLAIANSLGSAAIIGLTVHIVAWQTGRGVPAETAALVLSVLFISSMAGAFLAGYAADRVRSIYPLQVFYGLPLLGLALMAVSLAVPAQVVGAAFIGVAMGATTGLAPFLAARCFGLKASAEIFGVMMAMTMFALGVAPWALGKGFDLTGSYTWPFSVAAAVIAVSTVGIGLLDWSSKRHQRTDALEDAPK